MTRRSLSLLALLSVLVCASAFAQTSLFFADLRGSNEVPPTASTVVGSALFTIDSNNLLTFEINVPGIASPTAAHIHGPNGSAGTNAGVLVGFVPGVATFASGRAKGTVQITQANADAIRANPSQFYANVHTSASPGGEIRGQLQPAVEQDVPVAGNVTTGAGDKFVTDTRIFNPSSSKTSALVEFFPAGSGPNVNAAASKSVDLAPNAEAVLDDVTGPNGMNIVGQVGALRVTSGTKVLVTSNIYNDQRGATPSRGTFGQFVPAIARAAAATSGAILHLSNKNRDVTNPSGFRTNIGFFNPNQESVTVTLTLRDATGASLGTANVVLPGLEQQQTPITTLFPSVDLSNSAPLTITFTSTLPVIGYGAVNDNISGDSILVPAQATP